MGLRFALVVIGVGLTLGSNNDAGRASQTAQHRLDPGGQRSLGWLERQLADPFVSRQGNKARLIDSYEDARRAGWIYDTALAAIAFTAAEERTTAAELIEGLRHLQRPDGSWISSFDPDEASPRGSDRYAGAMAWVVMAANFFEWETHDTRFASMARSGLDYLERHRVSDEGSELYGAFRMGPSHPAAISTEHNADCYSAFAWRGRLEGNLRDLAIAGDVRTFVFRKLWMEPHRATESTGHFRVGTSTGGVYLDAQTWTVLAFADETSDARFEQALTSVESRLRVETGRLGAVRQIVGFDESDETTPHKVWAEGSEGVVAALFAVGQDRRARRYHEETGRYQNASGGVAYATENRAGWTTAPSVSAAGWYVLNSVVPPRNPFNPDRRIP